MSLAPEGSSLSQSESIDFVKRKWTRYSQDIFNMMGHLVHEFESSGNLTASALLRG